MSYNIQVIIILLIIKFMGSDVIFRLSASRFLPLEAFCVFINYFTHYHYIFMWSGKKVVYETIAHSCGY